MNCFSTEKMMECFSKCFWGRYSNLNVVFWTPCTSNDCNQRVNSLGTRLIWKTTFFSHEFLVQATVPVTFVENGANFGEDLVSHFCEFDLNDLYLCRIRPTGGTPGAFSKHSSWPDTRTSVSNVKNRHENAFADPGFHSPHVGGLDERGSRVTRVLSRTGIRKRPRSPTTWVWEILRRSVDRCRRRRRTNTQTHLKF
jgi:hypothetical protein